MGSYFEESPTVRDAAGLKRSTAKIADHAELSTVFVKKCAIMDKRYPLYCAAYNTDIVRIGIGWIRYSIDLLCD